MDNRWLALDGLSAIKRAMGMGFEEFDYMRRMDIEEPNEVFPIEKHEKNLTGKKN